MFHREYFENFNLLLNFSFGQPFATIDWPASHPVLKAD